MTNFDLKLLVCAGAGKRKPVAFAAILAHCYGGLRQEALFFNI